MEISFFNNRSVDFKKKYNFIFFSLCLGIALIVFGFSILNVMDYMPWYRFISNISIFVELILLILALIIIKNNYVPKQLIYILFLSLVPIIQYNLGLVNHFSTAFLSFSYILILFFGAFSSFNLFRNNNNFIHIFLIFIIILCCTQIILSYLQWLNINFEILSPYENNTQRIYGSFRQPNNLASYLLVSFLCVLYYIEKELIEKKLSLFLLLNIIFCLVLTQSRAGIVSFIFKF